MKKIIITLSIVGLAAISSATIINIPADYPTIQQGIDVSNDGDTVLVQPETYYENINFNGHNIVLGSLFLTSGDTSYISQTVIDGSQSPTGQGHVQFESGEDNSARITGFTIQNPNNGSRGNIYCENSSPRIDYNIIRDSYVFSPGAGISCRNYANPIIANNLITNNWSTEVDGGGGIGCSHNSRPVIMNNIISDNQAESGGGIYCHGNSDAVIVNNRVFGNSAGFFGGGIFCMTSSAVISGNTISGNTSHYQGGGLYCGGPLQIIISNNLIVGNSVTDFHESGKGGGIYCRSTDPLIINNTIFGNLADSVGGGLYSFVSIPHLINNIFWGDSIGYPDPVEANEIYADSGSPAVEYCDIQGGWQGIGNIDIDPLFRNSADGDLHLMATICGDSLDSPCIDVGSPYYADSLLDCSWGLGTSASDMGAYGGGDTAFVSVFEDSSSLPDEFNIKNYPNPFNQVTLIEFDLMHDCYVTIDIIDIMGRITAELVDGYRPVGRNFAAWDASNHASGIYFCRLQACEFKDIRRMVLIR